MPKKVFSVAASLFYSFCISVVVNYLVTFAFRPPAVYNFLPMLPVVLLRMTFLREKCTRPWLYVHAGIMLVISFLFYVVMYRKRWALDLSFAGSLMTLVLALWCILCVERKITLRKKDLGYPVFFVLVCALYAVLVWTHYDRRAAEAIDYIVQNSQPEFSASRDIDAFCWEIDWVLLGGDNEYGFGDLQDRLEKRAGSFEEEYKELQESLRNHSKDNIHALMNAIATPRE